MSDDQLWHDYLDNRERTFRDALVLRYAPLVRYVASRVGAGLPANVDSADLISAGMFGLIEAIERFDPAREVRFATFAIPRIRGSILDELRAMDWAPRGVRSRARWLQRATEALEHRLQRAPSAEEVADELGWSLEDVYATRTDVDSGLLRSLHEAPVDDEAGERHQVVDVTAEDPVLTHEVNLTRELLARAVALLPEREKVVVTLYYRENLTLAEIGEVLGVTESRVCQVYTNAALAMRECLAMSR